MTKRIQRMLLVLLTTMAVFLLGANIACAEESDDIDMDAVNEQALETLSEYGVGVAQVDLGGYMSAAITVDGDLYTWGRNNYGQLGNGTTEESFTPVKVEGLTDVVSVSFGFFHGAAVTKDGSLYTWGRNSYGQLGNGTTDDSSTPSKVTGLTDVVSVSLGDFHSAAVTENGELYTWGLNTSGQLGNGTTDNSLTPYKVTGLTDVASVSLGATHSAAVTKGGSLYAWGSNDGGQLGNGTTDNSLTPYKVTGLTDVASVSLGSFHSAAVTKDGNLYTWGWNDCGQLGNGSSDKNAHPTPTKVEADGLTGNVASVSLGYSHNAAVTASGDVYMWGRNSEGQLGNGTSDWNPHATPVKVEGLTDVASVSLGTFHSAALTGDGSLYLWGSSSSGQVGDGINTSTYHAPTEIMGIGTVVSFSLGVVHSAAVTEDGDLYTWGANGYGQLGNDTLEIAIVPTKVEADGLTGNVASVSLGGANSAAVTKDGNLYTWGCNEMGQLGNGTSDTSAHSTPTKVTGLTDVASVSTSGAHSAAVTKDGSLYTWGLNASGQLGNGTTVDSSTPAKVETAGLAGNVASVSLGDAHSAAVTKDGSLYTWGFNASGQLGNGSSDTSAHSTPTKVEADGLTGNVASVSLGASNSAAITKDGSLYTWGDNSYGQLGNGTFDEDAHPTPAKVTGLADVVSISLGDFHSAAVTENGELYTWGDNSYGQLGNGTSDEDIHPTPAKVTSLTGIASVFAGATHSAAVTEEGDLYTWGDNSYGQIGNGTSALRFEPVRIMGQTTWERLAGATALDTMSKIMDEADFATGGTVLVATIDGYWDALAATGAAGLGQGCVLLTDGTSLSGQTKTELTDLAPAHVIVCGGTTAVNDKVYDQIDEATGTATMARCAGDTATGTACEIYETVDDVASNTWSTTAIVVTNDGYWDALSIAPYAYAKGCPIFFTEGAESISDDTLATMRDGGVEQVYIVGGTAAVSTGVESQLKAYGIDIAGRLWGENAVATSQKVATFELSQGMTVDGMGAATRDGYWDALTGASLCGSRNSVVLLVADDDRSAITGFVTDHRTDIGHGYAFGGEKAVSKETFAALMAATE